MTDQQPKAQDPERIWLAPWSEEEEQWMEDHPCDVEGGRTWCQDDAWPVPGDDRPGVPYVRADLHEAELAQVRREHVVPAEWGVFDPETHRVVRRDAVVLERGDAAELLEDETARLETDAENGWVDKDHIARVARLRSALDNASRQED